MAVPANTKEKIFSEPERTKERIFNAAVDLFASKGFRGTSIRDIAGAVGMNTANLYHYFGNKEGLLLFILEQVNKSVVDRLNKTLEETQDLGPLDRYRSLLTSHLNWAFDHHKESSIFFLQEEELSNDGIMLMRKIHREVFDIYYGELVNLEKTGFVKGRDLRMLGICSEGVLQAALRYRKLVNKLTIEKFSEEIISYVIGGISYESGK